MVLAIMRSKEYFGHEYRKLMDVLREMPKVSNLLGLTVATLPHSSTVCTRKQDIPMRQWEALLESSVEIYWLGDVQGIDATGIDRVQASQHYAKHTEYTFEGVKTTGLIDCGTSVILDIQFDETTPR